MVTVKPPCKRFYPRAGEIARPRSGFTLIEMLTTLAILSTLLLLLSLAWMNISRMVARSSTSLQTDSEISLTLQEMHRALSQAVVRTNTHRKLNLLLTQSSSQTSLHFAKLDPQMESIQQMSFVTHLHYFWDKNAQTLCRSMVKNESAVNTQDVYNMNIAANATRLRDMTLSYASSAPYSWTTHPSLISADQSAAQHPLLRGVTEFQVQCFDGPPSANPPAETNWNDPTRLPHYIVVSLSITSQPALSAPNAPNAPANDSSKSRRFELWVPMHQAGMHDNTYGPMESSN